LPNCRTIGLNFYPEVEKGFLILAKREVEKMIEEGGDNYGMEIS